jgi:hypothetical protein
MKIDRFYWWSAIEIMPEEEARSESKSESNKKNLVCTLVHFSRKKIAHTQKVD